MRNPNITAPPLPRAVACRFVYTPRSGSRLLAVAASPFGICRVAVGECENRSYFVVGGVELKYHTATPGAWWRSDACAAAKQIVAACGGAAFDANGTITLYLPEEAAARADALMKRLEKTDPARGVNPYAAAAAVPVDPTITDYPAREENFKALFSAGYQLALGNGAAFQGFNFPPGGWEMPHLSCVTVQEETVTHDRDGEALEEPYTRYTYRVYTQAMQSPVCRFHSRLCVWNWTPGLTVMLEEDEYSKTAIMRMAGDEYVDADG